MDGQRHRHIGPLEQALAIVQEAIDQPRETGWGGVKGGTDGGGGQLLQRSGNDGGEQGVGLIYRLRPGGISVLPRVLNPCSRPIKPEFDQRATHGGQHRSRTALR